MARGTGGGISRRRFLQLAGAGLAAFGGFAPRAWADHTTGVVKPTPPHLFFTRGTNREMKWEAMKNHGYLTGHRPLLRPQPHHDAPHQSLQLAAAHRGHRGHHAGRPDPGRHPGPPGGHPDQVHRVRGHLAADQGPAMELGQRVLALDPELAVEQLALDEFEEPVHLDLHLLHPLFHVEDDLDDRL